MDSLSFSHHRDQAINNAGFFSSWEPGVLVSLLQKDISISQIKGAHGVPLDPIIEFGHNYKKHIDPASSHSPLSEVLIRFQWLPYFLAEVAYSALHNPLHIADWRALVHCLGYKMENLMDTWANEVELVLPELRSCLLMVY